jgi:hypothetical protein
VLDVYHDLKSAGGGVILGQVLQRQQQRRWTVVHDLLRERVAPVRKEVSELRANRHQHRNPDDGGEQLPACPPAIVWGIRVSNG